MVLDGVVGIFFGLLIPATAYGAITARLLLGHEMYSFLIGNNPFQWSYSTFFHLVRSPRHTHPIPTNQPDIAIRSTRIPRDTNNPSTLPPPNPMHLSPDARIRFGRVSEPSFDLGVPAESDCCFSFLAVQYVFLPSSFTQGFMLNRWWWVIVQAAYGLAKQKLFDIGAEAIIRFAAYRIRRRLQLHNDTVLRRRRTHSRRSSRNNQDQAQQGGDQQAEGDQQQAVAAPAAQAQAQADRPPVSFLFTTTLLFPFIASAAGHALHTLSRRSPAVRTLIGLRRDGRERTFARPMVVGLGLGMGRGFLDRVWDGFGGGRIVVKRSWGWDEFEPVWWRNVLGYAFYVVIHDAWDLVYAWLRVTERRSQKVVDRAFDSVDLGSLDLRESWRLGAAGQ
ncbi:hypothetical protein FRC12_012679 [Ceratobasidium sp. 428]|nr:hypothetical protein FRC12_012679 [Ceratobasidium sp. 428]